MNQYEENEPEWLELTLIILGVIVSLLAVAGVMVLFAKMVLG